jgi:hypothetical protein
VIKNKENYFLGIKKNPPSSLLKKKYINNQTRSNKLNVTEK